MGCLVLVCLFATGCNREAERQAELKRQARREFMESVATLKAAVSSGVTRSDFGKYRTGVEASYEVNKPQLVDIEAKFYSLSSMMSDCEAVWDFGDRYSGFAATPSSDDRQTLEILKSMTRITPSVTNKFRWDVERQRGDADFRPKNYARRALVCIHQQCEVMIADLRE